MDELWSQSCNTGVLFTWINFLQEDLFEFLKVKFDEDLVINNTSSDVTNVFDSIDPRAVKQPCSSILLQNYDKDEREFKFQKGYFTCNVCFNELLGKDCMKFNKCDHVFCNECMKTYFETQISDGNVKSLTCPHDKCEEQALPAQVKIRK